MGHGSSGSSGRGDGKAASPRDGANLALVWRWFGANVGFVSRRRRAPPRSHRSASSSSLSTNDTCHTIGLDLGTLSTLVITKRMCAQISGASRVDVDAEPDRAPPRVFEPRREASKCSRPPGQRAGRRRTSTSARRRARGRTARVLRARAPRTTSGPSSRRASWTAHGARRRRRRRRSRRLRTPRAPSRASRRRARRAWDATARAAATPGTSRRPRAPGVNPNWLLMSDVD